MSSSTLVLIALVVVGVALSLKVMIAVRKIKRQRKELWSNLDRVGIERSLNVLLRRGYDNAAGLLSDERSGLLLQFHKYIESPGTIGLELRFPRAEWSSSLYPKLQRLLSERGLQYRRVPVDDSTVDEYIRVDFGQDVALASEFACLVSQDLLEHSTVSFSFTAEGICPTDERVVSKDHPTPRDLVSKMLRR